MIAVVTPRGLATATLAGTVAGEDYRRLMSPRAATPPDRSKAASSPCPTWPSPQPPGLACTGTAFGRPPRFREARARHPLPATRGVPASPPLRALHV